MIGQKDGILLYLNGFSCIVYHRITFPFIMILVNCYNCHFFHGPFSRSFLILLQEESGERIAVTKNAFLKIG
jgi:hypothetical protein